MNIEKYKLIFHKILDNKEFDFYKQLVVHPTPEKTFEIVSKDITDGDSKKYEQYTYVKIRDYFASQFRKQISIKKKENKIKYYLTMIDFLNAGNSIYELGKMFKLKNPRTQFRRIIDYINKHSGTNYDYNDFKKKNNMTKIEKIQYQKDYEAGLKAFPLEVVLKNEAKQKRSNDKHKMTIAKKAAKETISDYAKVLTENKMLKAEIESLKAEINRLKQLKDINSDIPVELDPVDSTSTVVEKEHLIEYNELDKYFPDGLDESDYDKLSEDCKRKLDEEANLDRQQLDNNISSNNDELTKLKTNLANIENDIKQANNNDDIPNFIEDRFQEFIDKKYIGPATATILYKGLNPNVHITPKYKANGYTISEQNKTKDSNGNTPQQIIAKEVMKQYKSNGVVIKDKKLINRFKHTLNALAT